MTSFFIQQTARLKALKDAADGWLGTPFRDHWRTKGVGVDCIQLAVAIYSECGLIEAFDPPKYNVGAWKGLKSSPVTDWVEGSENFLIINETGLTKRGVLQPGDLLTFNHGRVVYHLGIFLGEGTDLFVHAITQDGVCKRTLQDSTWSKRLIAAYRPVEP